MAQRPTVTIGLLWHSPVSGNLGVGALTLSNLAIARAAAEEAGLLPRFIMFGPRDRNLPARIGDDIEVMGLDRRSVLTSGAYWSALGRLDCMLDISAGDSFADIYGPKRFFWMWITKRMAILRGLPLLLSPQTIGPFTRQPYSALAAGIMRKAELTIARDPLSYDVIGRMAPQARRMLSADVAFRLPFTPRAKAGDGKIHIGVNVSGLLWKQSEDGGNAYGLSLDYAALMRRLLDLLAAREDVRVHLITHVVDDGNAIDSDGHVADLLAAHYPEVIRVPAFAGPSEAKSYISGLDFLVAARMHACIAAFSSGVPVVPIAYSRKFMGLFGDLLGYPHTLPPEGYDLDRATAFILDRIGRRDELAQEVMTGNAKVAPLLDSYTETLRTLFARVARR